MDKIDNIFSTEGLYSTEAKTATAATTTKKPITKGLVDGMMKKKVNAKNKKITIKNHDYKLFLESRALPSDDIRDIPAQNKTINIKKLLWIGSTDGGDKLILDISSGKVYDLYGDTSKLTYCTTFFAIIGKLK